MCGRYTLSAPAEALRDLFDLSETPELVPRYNIAPTQTVPMVRLSSTDSSRRMDLLRWGLVPFFAREVRSSAPLINARAETVATLPSFRAAFKRRRGLMPVSGYFEWKLVGEKKKQPFLIRRPDGAPFALAAVYERWTSPEGQILESCALITTVPNDKLASIHHRMPVLIPPESFTPWLDPEFADRGALEFLLGPCPDETLEAVAVSTRINSPRFDDPECLSPQSSI